MILDDHFKLVLKTNVLQSYFFKKALGEIGINAYGQALINHQTGQCYHPDIGIKPMIFPHSLIDFISSLNLNKQQDYYFAGVITESRKWMLKYPNVINSLRGRNPAVKYELDLNYYNTLAATKFALCPVGDCPWSYRFFEAIMSHAIPVIGDREQDIYAHKYHFFRDACEKNYSKEIAVENYKIFINNHTLA